MKYITRSLSCPWNRASRSMTAQVLYHPTLESVPTAYKSNNPMPLQETLPLSALNPSWMSQVVMVTRLGTCSRQYWFWEGTRFLHSNNPASFILIGNIFLVDLASAAKHIKWDLEAHKMAEVTKITSHITPLWTVGSLEKARPLLLMLLCKFTNSFNIYTCNIYASGNKTLVLNNKLIIFK